MAQKNLEEMAQNLEESIERYNLLSDPLVGDVIKCPDCGSYMKVYLFPNGPADYRSEAVCQGCGTTITD